MNISPLLVFDTSLMCSFGLIPLRVQFKSIATPAYLASKIIAATSVCCLRDSHAHFCTIRKVIFNSFFVDVFNVIGSHFESIYSN
jgi:hypothetical protein